jgi:NTP pyrophosphatase (non-canonical NTP hydrolase)
MNIDELAKEIHRNASEKGFWDYMYENVEPKADPFIFFAKQIAMIHSEGTEVLEALRKQKGANEVVEELADVIIRVLDLYEGLRMHGDVEESLEEVLVRKMSINTHRAKMHGVLG